MYIIKSLLVLLILISLIVTSVLLVSKYIVKRKKGIHSLKRCLCAVLCCCFTLVSIALFGDYVYPFERTLNPVLIAEFQVPPGYELDFPGEKYWHGAYKQFGLYAESFYFDPENTDPYGIGWPPMDFDHFSYVITYGQKIESLSYNVWDTIDVPVRTGAKVGHMILQEDFSPEMVYIYRIPLIRIENDRNDLDRPWD